MTHLQGERALDQDPQLAILLGLEAVYRTCQNTPGQTTAQASSLLYSAVARSRWRAMLNSGHAFVVSHAAWSSDDGRIVTASADGSARIFIVDVGDLIRLACTRTERNMTQIEWRQYMGSDVPYRKTCPNLPTGQ